MIKLGGQMACGSPRTLWMLAMTECESSQEEACRLLLIVLAGSPDQNFGQSTFA